MVPGDDLVDISWNPVKSHEKSLLNLGCLIAGYLVDFRLLWVPYFGKFIRKDLGFGHILGGDIQFWGLQKYLEEMA